MFQGQLPGAGRSPAGGKFSAGVQVRDAAQGALRALFSPVQRFPVIACPRKHRPGQGWSVGVRV